VDDIIARRTGKLILSHREKTKKRKRSTKDQGEREADGDEGSEDQSDDEEDDEEDDEDEEEDEMEVDDVSDDGSGFGMGVQSDAKEDEDEDEEGASDEDGEADSDLDSAAEDEDDDEDDVQMDSGSDSEAESEEDTAAEKARKDAFFSTDPTLKKDAQNNPIDPTVPTSFGQMSLSRPLLRALTALNLSTPTPIQARSIPLALLGRDILGSAVTGSGKTAAFLIPILERLQYRDKSKAGAACRVLILCPTRELAVQCENVGKSLVQHSGLDSIRFALLVGGLSLSAQAHTLRTLPDILIATPGRLIDHINNSPSFTLNALDILVIDEADRMLEVGFSQELNEIIKNCPKKRQTMLFSATMTDSIDELVKLSLDRPVRCFVDPKRTTAKNLVQEFVRIRGRSNPTSSAGASGSNDQGAVQGEDRVRAATLLSLVTRTVKEKCIIFFRSKALAHQMRIVFGLCGLKASELHGNLTQEQVAPRVAQMSPESIVADTMLYLVPSVLRLCKSSRRDRWITCWRPTWLLVVSISRESRRSSTTICPVNLARTRIESVVPLVPVGTVGESRRSSSEWEGVVSHC
jgi:ATP-dependent RNA helicase DDX27